MLLSPQILSRTRVFRGGGGGGSGGTGGTEATAFLARTSGLDSTHRNAYIALIDGLVADSVWSKLDALYILATQDSTSALLNLVSTSFSLTVGSSPTFTADQGYTGGTPGGFGTYLHTGFAPSAGGTQFVQDSAHISAWSLTSGQVNQSAMGSIDGGNNNCIALNIRFTDDKTYFRINESPTATTVSNTDGTGHYIGNRSTSSAIQGYRNGSSVYTNGSDSSSGVGTDPIILLGINQGSTFYRNAQIQLAAASIGASLSSTNASNLYSRLRTFMTAVGVP